ncbi:ribosome biogenesis protein SLX9 homolog isoform X7 [Tursiops truncatus]|uniref:Protein FAM207A isoform X8 n=1 Tax=Tursiops truncatus TaxID=9739 RepID=A0A6J3RC93_TURTR|nr:protein FAM207A isoform X8 [Tursiops truncatus]
MGKVRGLRSRVHKAAVRPTGEAAPGPTPPAREAASLQASAGGVGGKEWAFMNASVFAGTTIDPSALVQKLDVDARSSASVRRVTYVPHQTSHLRCQGQGCFAQEGEAEAAAREVAADRAAIRPRAAQLSRMSAAQRFQLLEEERTRFRELLASPAYRASPLQAIGRQLAQQMRLEGSGQS